MPPAQAGDATATLASVIRVKAYAARQHMGGSPPRPGQGGDEEEGKPLKGVEMDVLLHHDRPGRRILGLPVSVFAGGAYCAASMSMVRDL